MLNLAHQRRLHLSKRLRIESSSKAERAEKELKSAEPFVFSEASL